ncbi:MAG TPA: AMP-binding protein [Polyangiales bacterium]|nr:AMP-binding protein [Polyangiales bacterium]
MKAEPTLVARLREHARARPEKVAMHVLSHARDEAAVRVTYAELDVRARAIAAFLQARSARTERALLLMPTGLEYVTGFLGALYAGAIAVPAYPPESQRRQHLDRVAGLARDAAPRFVLTCTSELPRLRGLIELVPELRAAELIALDVIDLGLAEAYDFEQAALTPDLLAFLQYTSGSLAAPKGVMVSHANLVANERAISASLAFDENDVMVSWLPLFHDMGLIGGLLQPLYVGASVVLMSALRFLERPIRWLAAISEYRATVSGGPDFAYRMCVDRIDDSALEQLDLSSWRVAFCGSEPIRSGTLTGFSERFAACGFAASAAFPCYGLAEATLLVTGVQPGSGLSVADGCAVSCGVTPPEHTLEIVDPATLQDVPAGQSGEIWVSGPSVAQGYWQNPDATAATFVQRGEQRFLRTGDLGFVRDAALFVSGRLKDLVIVRGRNLVPQDIEDFLASSISALQLGRIAVFPLQTEAGEAIGVAAELSRAAARSVRPEQLCQSIVQLVHESVDEPARLVILLNQGQLPRTSSGKLQRSACAPRLGSGELKTLAVYRDGVLESPPLSAAGSLELG